MILKRFTLYFKLNNSTEKISYIHKINSDYETKLHALV